MLEKTLESPLDCKEIQPVYLKGNQSWILIERTDAEVETPILWPPDAKGWLTGKDSDAGKDWRQEEKGTTEGWDGWMASLTRWTWLWAGLWAGVGDGQRGLACCSPWGRKESDTTERLNETERDWWDWIHSTARRYLCLENAIHTKWASRSASQFTGDLGDRGTSSTAP